ncbi:DUF4352 domain-containing protein [Naumannella sp. ID2617S]|nr:DUF4352 domain-containing protein [Naumannella sp. ID2617S]
MSQQQPPQRPHQQHPNYAMYPPQQGMQPPPAPQPKPKKPIFKRVWFWLLAGLVGIIVISQLSGGGSGASTAEPAGQSQPATRAARTTPPPAGLNTPVTDDGVEFTVTGFQCGVKVSDISRTLQPQGQFCKMDLTAKNTGTKQSSLMDDYLKVMDDKGAEYKSSSETWMVNGVILMKQINPGNTLTGSVYYDVPKEVSPSRAKLQGSLFGKGANVSLK